MKLEIHLYEAIIIIAFLLSIYFSVFGKLKLPKLMWFITTVFLFELFIEFYYDKWFGDNLVVLNLYSRICVYYYLYVFCIYFRSKKWMKTFKILALIYVTGTLLSYLIFLPAERIDYATYNIGMIMVLTLVGAYMYHKTYGPLSIDIRLDPHFYLAMGILLFYTASFPLLGFINFLIVENPYFEEYKKLLNLGNTFLSLGYLGVVLCSINRKQSIGLLSHHS